MCGPIRIPGMAALALVVTAHVSAASQVTFVPWKVLQPGVEPAKKAFVLFWIPSSPDEMRRSDLITSERLTAYAARCVGMQVVRADDGPRLVQLRAEETLPVAVLVEGDKEIARVGAESGPLSAPAVEAMVRDVLDSREASLKSIIDRAMEKATGGDNVAAINLYREVAAQQCAFPRLAKTAQRALRRLGSR